MRRKTTKEEIAECFFDLRKFKEVVAKEFFERHPQALSWIEENLPRETVYTLHSAKLLSNKIKFSDPISQTLWTLWAAGQD